MAVMCEHAATRRTRFVPPMSRRLIVAALGAAVLTFLAPGSAQQGPTGFDLPWTTIDGGGGMSSSASFDMFATVGQPDAFEGSMSSARFDLYGGFWYARFSDTTCPESSDNLLPVFGRVIQGDTSVLCASDDQRIQVVNVFPVTPLLPFVRFEIWAYSNIAGSRVTSVSYLVEGYCTAIVAGGQNGDTLRTRIRNYATGVFELVDVRPTGPFDDELIEHTQVSNAAGYVQATDGEVRVRMEGFNPGAVINAAWEIRVDALTVTVNQD